MLIMSLHDEGQADIRKIPKKQKSGLICNKLSSCLVSPAEGEEPGWKLCPQGCKGHYREGW